MKINQEYQYLLNKTKKEVKQDLGQDFNFYPSDIWWYHLKTSWLGRKTFLFIHFKDEQVFKITIKKCYGKINP